MKKTKKLLATITCIFLLGTANSYAAGGFEPGIYKQTNNNSKTYSYEEVTFITGKPVLLKGTVTLTKVDREKENDLLKKEIEKAVKKNKSDNSKNDNKVTLASIKQEPKVSYTGTKINEKYNLYADGIKLTRDISITPKNEYYKGQIIQKEEISKIKETINTGSESYNLDSDLSEVSESVVIDKKPAINYFAGNSNFYKVYTLGKGKNSENSKKVVIQMDGKSFGYDGFWGQTETKIMNYTINTTGEDNTKKNDDKKNDDKKNDDKKNEKDKKSPASVDVNGTYTVKLSQNTVKDLIYSENDPKKISFRGGYIVTSQNNSAMEYNYDINGIKGKGNYQMENMPDIKRLFAPVLTDVQGHYAEDAIKVITSMNGFDIAKKVFLPDSPISRDEFARAMVVASGIYDNNLNKNANTNKKKINRRLKEELFSDVKTTNPNYDYVKEAVENKVMIGRDDNKFEPRNPITRAEAVSVMVNSLGLDSLIPNGKFNTSYEDQANIPSWAYDSVFIAQNVGLIDKGGAFRPNEVLSKADACEMLLRYIGYMTSDLKDDYMKNILNY